LTHTDDPLTHPQSELKTVYAELFEPCDWVEPLFTLSRSALYLSGSITQLRTKAGGYVHDIARDSGDLNCRLQQYGAD
jgi:methyl-accepting chemotaxis protein